MHQETFGKSGARRIVPGEYLAVDPKGRACMVGAVEKQKLVYVLNRDSAANLTISSPLEAHKSHNIVFSIVGLDCGFDNAIFAAIELDYSDADQVGEALHFICRRTSHYMRRWPTFTMLLDRRPQRHGHVGVILPHADTHASIDPLHAWLQDPTGEAASQAQKHLTYYELDFGLNHVARKWSDPVDNGANLLIPVPGGGDGPGGVLVAADNFIIYKDQDHAEARSLATNQHALLPGLPCCRSLLRKRKCIASVCRAVHAHAVATVIEQRSGACRAQTCFGRAYRIPST